MSAFVPPPHPPAPVTYLTANGHTARDRNHHATSTFQRTQHHLATEPLLAQANATAQATQQETIISIPVPAPETSIPSLVPTQALPVTEDEPTVPSTGSANATSPVPVVEIYHPSLSAQPDQAYPLAPSSPPNHDALDLGAPIAVGAPAAKPVPSIPITTNFNAAWEQKNILQHLAIAPPQPATSSPPITSQHFILPGLSPAATSSPSHPPSHLLVQDRQGNVQEFKLFPEPTLISPDGKTQPLLPPENPQSEAARDEPTPLESSTENEAAAPVESSGVKVLEVIADEQEYFDQEQIVIATGNAIIRFSRGVLTADQVRVNLPNRVAVAEGNVILQRGDQILRGERFEYYFVQDNGVVYNASGEVYQPSAGQDFSPNLPTDDTDVISGQTLNERLAASQPLQRVTTTGGYEFSIGFGTSPSGPGGILELGEDNSALPQGITRQQEGSQGVNRLRFKAERIDFDADGWHATKVRLTNDPFSPPELELRANTADFRNIAPFVDELVLTKSQVVFDQTTAIPAFQNRLVFDRRPRDSALNVVNFGYDGQERGGLFVERTFTVYSNQKFRFNVTPQYFLQQALVGGSFEDFDGNVEEASSPFSPSVFGLINNVLWQAGPDTEFRADTELTSFDFDVIEDELRTRVQVNQMFGGRYGVKGERHTLRVAYNFRERLFNGSLGFQTVQSSLGALVFSPEIVLGSSLVRISYQGSIQSINADTDRLDLLDPIRDNNRVTLTRLEGAASIRRDFRLWTGKTLPATREEGLRFVPTPVSPFFDITTGITGVSSYYSNGDNQPSLRGSIGFRGQFGHFSRSFFDFTGIQLTYSNSITGDQSPFLFDRFVDQQTLSFGFTQQVYGPFRFGVQGFINLDTGDEISTNYYLEYSRRTYNVLLRYNPVQEVGSINFRVNDFNWTGHADPFEQDRFRPVIQGVTR